MKTNTLSPKLHSVSIESLELRTDFGERPKQKESYPRVCEQESDSDSCANIQSAEMPNEKLGSEINRQLFQMRSCFGYSSNAEMLTLHFGDDFNAMIRAANRGNGGTIVSMKGKELSIFQDVTSAKPDGTGSLSTTLLEKTKQRLLKVSPFHLN